MVIVLAVIKTNKPILEQGLDIRGRRINHLYDLLLFTLEFPAHDKQVRKHFTVEEYNWCIRSDWSIIFTVFRLEVHDTNFLHTIFCIMTTTSSKSSNDVTHVANIITERRIVCIIKDLLNEVDRGLGIRMILLAKIPFNHCPQSGFRFNLLNTLHRFFSFQR